MSKLSFLLLYVVPAATLAASVASAPQSVTLTVDQDLVMVLKWTIWVGGIFLFSYASIGLAFFGWDVRKARASLGDAQKETRDKLQKLQIDFDEMKKLKEKLEQLGAQLEEGGSEETKEPPLKRGTERTNIDLIREVIRTSNYEWTTIGRVVKRTGLSQEDVLVEVRKAPEIYIGTGRKTQNFIFKINSDA
jgi:hypothetical protein